MKNILVPQVSICVLGARMGKRVTVCEGSRGGGLGTSAFSLCSQHLHLHLVISFCVCVCVCVSRCLAVWTRGWRSLKWRHTLVPFFWKHHLQYFPRGLLSLNDGECVCCVQSVLRLSVQEQLCWVELTWCLMWFSFWGILQFEMFPHKQSLCVEKLHDSFCRNPSQRPSVGSAMGSKDPFMTGF